MRLADVLSPAPRRARPLDEWVMVLVAAAVVGWDLLTLAAALGVSP